MQQKVQRPKKFGGAPENVPQHTVFFLWNCIEKSIKKDGQCEEHFQEHLGDQYHCEPCNKLFTSNHMRHMHKGQHTCEICTKKNSIDNNLKQHISNKHDNKQDKFFCGVCDKTFSTKSN